MNADEANKYMLLGVEFALKVLGVDQDGLLARFVKQEFQAWVKTIKQPSRKPPDK